MVQGITPSILALKAFGKRMGVTSNNIANVNTPGFKKSRSTSQEFAPQTVAAAGGPTQIGRGSTLGEISETFVQGGFMPTSSPTDLAIGGDGFFPVRSADGQTYYTRDGSFHFDRNGDLVNSAGNILQGWAVDPQSGTARGAVGDISLTSFTSPPAATTHVRTIVNLDADATDQAAGPGGLAGVWDGDNANQQFLPASAYEYSTSVPVIDSVGATHDMTIYFDKAGTGASWEYIVTVNPLEDQRAGATGDDLGLLGRGQLTFDANGHLTDMTLERNDGAGGWTAQDPATDLVGGHFTVTPDFLGAASGGTAMPVQIDLGARHNGAAWVNDSAATTQYAAASNTVYATADGYGAGDLRSVAVSTDGVITGNYSNGASVPLYQVALADFNNPRGLKKVGENMYAASSAAGAVTTAAPGANGLGRLAPNVLEGSNVDLAEEVVNMMVFKSGFQANLKVIEMENQLKGDVLDIIS